MSQSIMRVHINPDRCQGHGRCKALAPDLFELDENGYAHAAADGVPAGLEHKAALARANCPEFAVIITEG